jgi:uncharacterized membrane protein YgdD (TMEM256/DUF423 family)
MKTRITLFTGAMLMAITVGLGAFGSHVLKATLETTGRFGTFELAIRYLFIHASALLILGALMDKRPRLFIAASLLLAGMLFFSGSLLMLAFTNTGPWGAITPVGGTLFVAGWLVAAWAILKH